MDKFVVGFGFTIDEEQTDSRVLLVKKNRPAWQKGRLNGIGGKIEAKESPQAAMARECLEETGLELTWTLRGLLRGTNIDGRAFECHLFYAYSNDLLNFQQREDEPIGLYRPEELSTHQIVDSLDFLIPYGLSKDRLPFMTLTY
ncbi:MAG: NUDIX domain-containing protein [Desulfobacter sp.]|nr:MAG: NUDIX domain-containing protein [Desulfobacter sp.]